MAGKFEELSAKIGSDESLAAKFEEELRNAAAAGATSDSEVISMAAAAMGVQITAEEVEQETAERQRIADEDLEMIAGGASGAGEDRFGHDNWCITVWHCYLTLTHDDGNAERHHCVKSYKNPQETCLSNFQCVFVSQGK